MQSQGNRRGVGDYYNNSLSNLPILYFNARSLLPKFDELLILCETYTPGIVCIVESWLSEDIEDSELIIPNYQVLRLDRNRHGGGILLYIHNSLTYNVISTGPSNLELMLISVGQASSTSKFCIGVFYRSPSSPYSCMDDFYSFLEDVDISLLSNLIFVGDFNINFYNTHHPLYHKMEDIMSTFSLTQIVKDPTHVNQSEADTLLDLVLTSSENQVESCEVLPPLANSDHKGILFKWKWKETVKHPHSKLRTIWRYNWANFEMARNLLSNVNWDSIVDQIDVNNSLRNWENCFMEVMERCIPKGTLPQRKTPPWMTKNLLRAMCKRNHLFRRARNTNHPTHWQHYRAHRNKTVSMLRQSKQAFFANNLSISNKKLFWKTMKYLRKGQSTIPTLSCNGQEANNDIDKANMLNNFFADCFNTKLPPLSVMDMDSGSHECPENLLCTEQEVLVLLKSIDTSKASGPDKISGRMLKETAVSIAKPISMIFNLSIKTGVFPNSWKLSSVVPIPKSSDNISPTNYRPISLLSILSKLLEKYIHGLIMDHLESEHTLSTNQWGFQAGKSTVAALLGTCHNWLETMEKGKEVEAIFFDFKKAFDTVPHEALIDKLQELQLDRILVKWIRSYLTDRKQQVVVNGATSDTVLVLSGVPQGSVLGPLLFLIYIDGINGLSLSPGSNLVLYADDMLLYRPISSRDDYTYLQADINAVSEWVDANLLQFNVKKCKVMKISRKNQGVSGPTPDLKLHNQTLERVDAYKYLGLY